METLKELEQLLDISGNMRCYRQAIAEATAPAIPFLRKSTLNTMLGPLAIRATERFSHYCTN